MTHFFTPPLHKNQIGEEHCTPGGISLKESACVPSSRDDEASISNGNKTPLSSSSSSSESKKETNPDMGSNNKSLDKDSSGKRKSTDGEDDDSVNKKMKTTPTSPQSPTGINNDSHSIIKMLGPLHLPDFKNRHEIDLHLLQLKSELASTNSQLKKKSNSKKPSSPSLLPLTTRRQRIISDLIRENPTFNPTNPDNTTTTATHSKLCRKLYIPVRKYPNHNFIGPIIGPRGQNQKRMQRETGAKINVRGRGASRSQQHENMHPDSSDDLHVYIEAETQQSLDSATAMVEKMLLLPRGHHHPEETTEVEAEEEKEDEYAKKEKEKVVESSSSIYVANLPQGVEEGELQRIFSCYGEINSTRVMRDRCTGCSRGYGFVNFERPEGAAMAVKVLNGKSVGGKVMVVRMAEVKSSVWVEKKKKMVVVPPPPQMVLRSGAFVPLPQICSTKGPCWCYENRGGGDGDGGGRSLPFYHSHILPYSFYAAAPAPVNPPFPYSSNY